MNNGLVIQGDNIHVYKYVDATPFEIVCAETMTLRIVQEMIGATTPDSGYNKEKRLRMQEFFLALTGVMTSDNDGDVSIFYMQNKIREAHDLEIVYNDNNGSQRSFRADFFIQEQVMNGNTGESGTYELNMEGTGDYTESVLVDPVVTGENATSDYYVVSGGKITDPRWVGLSTDNIIEVCREGTEQLSMGLPYSLNSGTGDITPDAGTTMDGQRMFVLWTY